MRHAFVYISFGLIIIGCQENSDQDPISPSLISTLNGQTILIDEYGKRLVNHSGILIEIVGTNYSTVTDSTGHWSISSIKEGTYDISVSKTGYISYKIKSFKIVGGGTVYLDERNLFQIPTFNIHSLTVGRSISDKYMIVSGQTSPVSSHLRFVLIFVNTNSNVSSVPTEYRFIRTMYTDNNTNSFSRTIYSSELGYYGISSGTKLFFRAYPNIWGWISSYTDSGSVNPIYTTIGPNGSNIDSVVVP